MKRRIHEIAGLIAELEHPFGKEPFVAPALRGGIVHVRVAETLYTFKFQNPAFEGWGSFMADDEYFAYLGRWPPSSTHIQRYLAQLRLLHVILAARLDRHTYAAWPADESDMRQRFGLIGPVFVHLVGEVDLFDEVLARSDGRNFWFQETNRLADPKISEYLRRSLLKRVPSYKLEFPHLTPELRTAYRIAFVENKNLSRKAKRRKRYAIRALEWAGATVEEIHSDRNSWLITWRSRSGRSYTSLVRKKDFVVIEAGICLDGRDRLFDLKTLVSVVEQWEENIDYRNALVWQ